MSMENTLKKLGLDHLKGEELHKAALALHRKSLSQSKAKRQQRLLLRRPPGKK